MLDLYEKFHNIEEVDSMAALAYERNRYKKLLKKTKAPEIVDELTSRIDELNLYEKSIKEDIANDLLKDEDYFAKCK